MDSKEILVQERCIKQPAQIAAKNVKFLSSQKKADQFTAEIVTLNTDQLVSN